MLSLSRTFALLMKPNIQHHHHLSNAVSKEFHSAIVAQNHGICVLDACWYARSRAQGYGFVAHA